MVDEEMAAEDEKPEKAAERPEGVDELGLVVQTYVSTVLVVVPAKDYAETTLRYARSSLYNVHVGTRSVSTVEGELILGEFQDEFQVDGPLAGETMEPYSGLIVVGGKGALALADDPDVRRLIDEAHAQKKLIGTWGHGLACLARSSAIRGCKVTGDRSLADAARKAGAKYTGVQVQRDRHVVTAIDDAAGLRFGRELIQVVGIG